MPKYIVFSHCNHETEVFDNVKDAIEWAQENFIVGDGDKNYIARILPHTFTFTLEE